MVASDQKPFFRFIQAGMALGVAGGLDAGEPVVADFKNIIII